MNFCVKKQHLLLLFIISFGCKTQPGNLTILKEGDFSKLDENFELEGYIGKTNINLASKENFSRFVLNPPDEPEEYILLIDPISAVGDLEIPKRKATNAYIIPEKLHAYVDALLKAHRAFSQREYEISQREVGDIEKKFGVTFGSLILEAKLAYIRGDLQQASRYFQQAKSIYGNSQTLNALLGK